MRMFLKAAAVSGVFTAIPAVATPLMITPITVSGSDTGTTWNTAVDNNYTLFIQHPVGKQVNPNDDFSPTHIFTNRASDYLLIGDGFPTNSRSGNSDPVYNLAVEIAHDGVSQWLSGNLDGATGAFTVTNATARFEGVEYTLTNFNWMRGMSNLVGSYSVGSATYAGQPSGSLSDYQGAFTLSAASVPEPSTWAMMIIGLGAVAGTMRVRRKTAPALG
ncbi:PEPxxWA-CTERM sorting domain-containing protein [Sphingomonas sp.]|uniref:PEPxxWA-CTERM sorting domain-containing protein n=1 Tax=Sphingomonas sp. TaxID=28214 RepID=UPI00257EAF0E|nr:PEPxxWA-CTERM sorting domain-containing protein [Sphingomonas sp.]